MASLVSKIAARFGYRKVKNDSVFKGAQGGSFWDWIIAPTTIDYQIRTNIFRLRTNARLLALNNPIVRQYLQLLAQNVIGPKGMTLKAQVRNNNGDLNKGINDKIEAGWAEFWRSPFVDGNQSGPAGERLLIKSVARDGEAFVRKCIGRQFNRFGFALQLIDPDLVDHTYNCPRSPGQNEIRLGIEVDEWSKAQAIWVWNSYPQDINSAVPQQRTRIPANEIIHIFDPERTNQTRGITWMNSVMLSLKHLDGFMEAKLVAERTAACAFPLFERTDIETTDENQKDFKIELNPGSGISLPPGFKVSNWNPTPPGGAVKDYVKACLRFFASGLSVSYNALANDLEGVNYSSLRSGLLMERDNYRVLQQWWIGIFLQPVYESWLQCALLSSALVLDSRDPAKFKAVKWTPRGWMWVDPLKDVNGAVISIENGLDSRTSSLAEKGMDVEEVFEELQDEQRLAKQYGLSFIGAAVAPKDVLKETEEKTGATQEEMTGATSEPADAEKAAKARKHLRLVALAERFDDEEIDAQRVEELMRLYRSEA